MGLSAPRAIDRLLLGQEDRGFLYRARRSCSTSALSGMLDSAPPTTSAIGWPMRRNVKFRRGEARVQTPSRQRQSTGSTRARTR